MSTRQLIGSKRLRDLNEKQMEEKSKHFKEDIVPTSLRASIEDDDSEISIVPGWTDAPSIDEISEGKCVMCIEHRCKRSKTREHVYLVDQAVRSESMNTNVSESEGKIWRLRRENCNNQRSAAYANITESKPHIAIKNILKKPKPPQLNRRMLDIMTWRKNKNFHKENFDRFVREAAVHVRKV